MLDSRCWGNGEGETWLSKTSNTPTGGRRTWPGEARCNAKWCQASINHQRAVSSVALGQGHSGCRARPSTDESRCHFNLLPNSAQPAAVDESPGNFQDAWPRSTHEVWVVPKAATVPSLACAQQVLTLTKRGKAKPDLPGQLSGPPSV